MLLILEPASEVLFMVPLYLISAVPAMDEIG
jgi:hypothetical protein